MTANKLNWLPGSARCSPAIRLSIASQRSGPISSSNTSVTASATARAGSWSLSVLSELRENSSPPGGSGAPPPVPGSPRGQSAPTATPRPSPKPSLTLPHCEIRRARPRHVWKRSSHLLKIRVDQNTGSMVHSIVISTRYRVGRPCVRRLNLVQSCLDQLRLHKSQSAIQPRFYSRKRSACNIRYLFQRKILMESQHQHFRYNGSICSRAAASLFRSSPLAH